jgi:hypothetical protein
MSKQNPSCFWDCWLLELNFIRVKNAGKKYLVLGCRFSAVACVLRRFTEWYVLQKEQKNIG